MIKLRIGGVPEHFNLPWHLGLEERRFARSGVDLEWRDYPGGSGAMAKALRVGDLDGAVAAFAAGTADVFFWEKLMTKPLVDTGRFRRIGEFTAPWPAFVVCAVRAMKPAEREALGRAVGIALDAARALRARPDAAQLIAARYGLKAGDVAEWLETVRWSERAGIAADDVAPACMALGSLGVLPSVVDAAECVAPVSG